MHLIELHKRLHFPPLNRIQQLVLVIGKLIPSTLQFHLHSLQTMELVEFGDVSRHILLIVEELEHNSIVVIQKTIAVFKNASVQIGRRHHINVQQQEVRRFNAVNANVTQYVQRIDSFGILLLRRIPPQVRDNRGQAPNVDVEQDVLSVDRHDELC